MLTLIFWWYIKTLLFEFWMTVLHSVKYLSTWQCFDALERIIIDGLFPFSFKYG